MTENQKLREALQTAIWRLEDILKRDDAQAWKEAEKALPKLQEALATPPDAVVQGEPVADAPLGAIVNGREHARRLVDHYGFNDLSGHDLRFCHDWTELLRCFEHLADHVMAQHPAVVPEDVQRIIKEVCEAYRGTDLGKVAESICDNLLEAITAAQAQGKAK